MKNVMALACILLLGVPSVSIGSVSDDQVTSIKIKEADGTSQQDTNSGSGVKTNHIQNLAVTGAKIAGGAVTTDKIVDGAVTNAKIQDVSAAKVTGTVGNADTVDNVHASQFAPASHTHQYGRVAIVAKSGGDFSDPLSAVEPAAYAQWCGEPSSTNRCLLKIMPGTYDLGSSGFPMQEFADVEGAGEDVTIITSAVDGYDVGTVVAGGGDAEMRFLTVKNTGAGQYNRAIVNSNSQNRYEHVTAMAVGAATDCTAVFNRYNGSPVLTDVTAVASGGIDANFGVRAWFSSVTMNGGAAIASGGVQSVGVSIGYSSATSTIADAVASASGASGWNIGIDNSNSTTVMKNATASAKTGVSLTAGIYNFGNSSLTMTNVAAVAEAGATNYGVYAEVDGNLTVLDRCTVQGSPAVKGGGDGLIFKIGASKIVGGVGNGTFSCAASYDGNYAPLDATCH